MDILEHLTVARQHVAAAYLHPSIEKELEAELINIWHTLDEITDRLEDSYGS